VVGAEFDLLPGAPRRPKDLYALQEPLMILLLFMRVSPRTKPRTPKIFLYIPNNKYYYSTNIS
jgi:hypothetical protein